MARGFFGAKGTTFLLLFFFFFFLFIDKSKSLCFECVVYCTVYSAYICPVEPDTVSRFVPQILWVLCRGAQFALYHDTDYGTMPPRRGTAWASHGTLLSERIRPSPGSPQPTKSDKGKGKGKAKAATPEPPPRSAAVRRLDDILDGFHSSSNSNQLRNETKRTMAAPGAASADRDGCFCQGTSPLSSSPCPLSFFVFPTPFIHFCIGHLNCHRTSPSARTVRIHPPLLVVRTRPLRFTTAAPPLPTLRRAAPRAARAGGARRAAGGVAGVYA